KSNDCAGECSTYPSLKTTVATSEGMRVFLPQLPGTLIRLTSSVGIQDYNGCTIIGGGDVTLNVNGSLTVAKNTHPVFLFFNTFNGGFIDTGGNIFASVVGDVFTGNMGPAIQNQDGGTINAGG